MSESPPNEAEDVELSGLLLLDLSLVQQPSKWSLSR